MGSRVMMNLGGVSTALLLYFCGGLWMCLLTLLMADGFFDAGMLLQALKAKDQDTRGSDRPQPRREVGKRLRLMEY